MEYWSGGVLGGPKSPILQHSSFIPSLQPRIRHEDRSGEFLFRLGMTHRALQNEIKEQRIVVVDFVERLALFGRDESVAGQGSSPDQ